MNFFKMCFYSCNSFDWLDWGSGQPADSDPDEDCAFLRTTGNWRSLICTNDYEMVLACEHAPSEGWYYLEGSMKMSLTI